MPSVSQWLIKSSPPILEFTFIFSDLILYLPVNKDQKAKKTDDIRVTRCVLSKRPAMCGHANFILTPFTIQSYIYHTVWVAFYMYMFT